MIFREQEFRASGVNCGRDPGGQFAANNDCAGSGASATATSSDWKQATGTKEWISSDLKKSPPIKGGDKLEALTVRDVPSFRRAQNAHGLNLDEIITLGGGPIRGAEIWAASYGGKEISVSTNIPIDPDDPDKGSVETSVTIDVDPDTNSSFIDYGTLFPDADAELDDKSRNRIASVMMERMIDSMSMAHDAGFSHAQTLAIGSKDSIDKGYRLWPQFGFDAKLPKELFDKIPKELLDKTPRVAKSSKLSRKSITLQELISTREGERWWDDNGDGIEMTLKFTDEKSLGFKRFMEMKKKLPRLKERNKSRSYLDWLDLVELRDDCGRQAGGRFGQGNNCAVDDGGANVSGGGGGTAVSDRGPKVDTDWWRSEGEAKWNSSKIKKSPPVTGGHVLNSFTVPDVGELASAMTDIGSFKSFDDVVTIGGGIRRGADIKVEGEGDMIRTKSTMPISPDGSGKDGTAEVNVTLFDNGEGFSVSYDELYVDFPEGEEDSPEAVRRVSSVLMERMTESLAKAEAIGAHTAETSAAGGATNRLKGYRLWPQFGFDGEIPKIHEDGMRELAERAIAGRGEENYDNPPAWAVKILDKLDSGEPVMMQELVASREGKNWWDENGAGINLTLDFRKKNSLGYKRYEKMKSLLSRLKDRNKNRQWVSFDDVEFRGDCTDADKAEGGRFAEGNDCGGDGGGADSVASKVKESKQRNVDVMVGGQKTVAVLDKEARDRAASDFNKNKPPDSAAGSTSDLWGRTFVERSGKSSLKITSADPVFPMDRLAQSGTYVSHESVGQFLAMRHEERRASSGGSGPGAMIDTTEPLGDDAKQYIVDALAEDAIHAYSQGRLNPGFYSSDLEDAISRMSTRHPELASDENARFVFTMITAITSNGQNPEQNIADADGLYDMYKRHGTCVPDRSVGGSRDASKSLSLFQSMIDSFGVDRTRRLLSGYTSAENVNQTLKRLSDKSGDPDWRERTGSTAWMQEHFSQPPGKAKLVKTDAGGELPDEIVPMASIFGPKIGSFFANLNGRHDFLTMDRWLMRSVGRATGELLTRSTPKQAKSRAEEALKALEDGKWSRSLLFGTDKTHGITKESLIRSLKIQAATGVIEENGAAYIWATAAERSHKNTPKPTGGQYGKHPDKRVHALHTAGNSLFKSLIHEQQDPRGAQARRNIREVFREVVKKIEEKFPDRKGKVDIDEVQAVLWQYEKNLWKHLGANTKIDENSLYSKAAEDLLSGKTKQRKFSPGSQRELLPREDEQDDGLLDTYRFEAEQEAWLGDVFESGIDFNELFLMLEESFKEQRNFAALDAVEVRSNDCGRDEGGRFGSGNKCAIASGESADGTWEVEPNIGGTTMRPDSEPAPHVLRLKGSDGEVKAFMHATVVGDSSPPKLYVDYSEVAEKHRGKGVYTNLLDSLSNQFTVVSDSPPNLALAASKAYKKLGAEKQWDDSYVLYKKSNKSSRSADCGRDDSGRFGAGNDCASEDGSAESSQPAPADFRTESDKSRPSSTVSTPNGNIEVVDRSDIGTPDYLDEIECSGSKCGLSVTFEDAKKLQPSSGIDPSWSPIDAYIGKGYGYFTGNSQVGGESIDFHGKKYGTIDDFRANELKAEMLKKAEAEWDSMSDEQKAKEASVSVEFWKSGTQGDRDAYKKAWLGRKEHEEIWGKIDDLRSAARDKAVKQMREEPEKAVARETLDCCLQLYRGINIDDVDAEEILRNGRIAHSSANSWTTSRGTARSFGGNRLLLVLRKPRVGYVFAPNTHSEAEVVRPPSSMKIVGAARTKTGMVLYVEEDEDY